MTMADCDHFTRNVRRRRNKLSGVCDFVVPITFEGSMSDIDSSVFPMGDPDVCRLGG
jgi:hypothetical protein